MRILIIHNAYGTYSGEEAVVEKQVSLLRRRGHEVIVHWRDSKGLAQRPLGRLRACVTGIVSLGSRREIRGLLQRYSPNVVNFHNLFPLISPSVLPEFGRQNVPTVMTVHNYRLACPTGLHMSKRTLHVCDKCCGGREYWCVVKDCEASLPKSIGYALRNWVARRFRLFLDNVAVYACLTQFQRRRLIAEGFPADRITVLPNMAEDTCPAWDWDNTGAYVGYAGRISAEKGIDKLLAAAKELQGLPFQAAGSYDSTSHLPDSAPENLRFLGFLERKAVRQFILGSRFMVLCSTWFEGFPMAVAEAMVLGKAVIASRIGGIPELVEDHVTGLLVEPGNVRDLAHKIRYLWDRPDVCRQMGRAGREKALREYSPERYYERLMAVYEKAIQLGPPCHGADHASARSGARTPPPWGSGDSRWDAGEKAISG